MSYRLILSRTALKALRSIPTSVNERIASAIDGLKHDPRPLGCKKLKSKEELWRIRIGDYRVIYAIDDVVRIVDVRRIGHRGDIYE